MPWSTTISNCLTLSFISINNNLNGLEISVPESLVLRERFFGGVGSDGGKHMTLLLPASLVCKRIVIVPTKCIQFSTKPVCISHRLNLFEETQPPEESDGAVYPAALQLVAETAVDSYWEPDIDAAQSQTAVAVDSYLATVVDTDQSQTAVAVDTYLATVVDTAQSQTAVNDNSETAAAVDTHNDILEVGSIAAEAAAAAAGLQNPGTALSGSGDSAADCLRVDPGSSHRIPHPV